MRKGGGREEMWRRRGIEEEEERGGDREEEESTLIALSLVADTANQVSHSQWRVCLSLVQSSPIENYIHDQKITSRIIYCCM